MSLMKFTDLPILIKERSKVQIAARKMAFPVQKSSSFSSFKETHDQKNIWQKL